MKNTNITYLFGAGASIQQIPIVNNLYAVISEYIKLFRIQLNINDKYRANTLLMNDFYNKINDIKHHLVELEKILSLRKQFKTIDTIAKYYALKGDDESLKSLKKHFSIFLLNLQLFKKSSTNLKAPSYQMTYPFVFNYVNDETINDNISNEFLVDQRYVSFLASLLDPSKDSFPNNIKFLSWNYDSQFQLAWEYFKTYKIAPFYPSIKVDETSKNFKDLSYIHLNGCAGIKSSRGFHSFITKFLKNQNGRDTYFSSIFEYFDITDPMNHLHYLNFAWEDNPLYNNQNEINSINNFFETTLEETEIFIVIGYSFPDFNRELDSFMINKIKDNQRLKKIIIQDIKKDMDKDFKVKFDIDNNTKLDIVPYVNGDEFITPINAINRRNQL